MFQSLLKRHFRLLTTLGILSISSLQLSGCSSQLKYEPSAQNDGRSAPVIKSTPDLNQGTCPNIYVVKPGDSLNKIANKCDVSPQLLQEVNNIRRADLIYINQELRIPYRSTADATEQNDRPAVLNPKPVQPSNGTQVFSREQSTFPSEAIDGNKRGFDWVWPMNKQTDYRFVRDAKGISALEIYGFVGQSVYAMADGKVVFAGDGITDFGNMIMLRHPDGKLSIYAHNNKLLVAKGDQVKAGQSIAEMGATGITKRPKLYVETRYQGQKISIKNILGN